MNENDRSVNVAPNLRETIPTVDSNAKTDASQMPKLMRKSDERKTENFSVRITPSIRALLNEIARQENASPNSVINWLIEVEATRRGL